MMPQAVVRRALAGLSSALCSLLVLGCSLLVLGCSLLGLWPVSTTWAQQLGPGGQPIPDEEEEWRWGLMTQNGEVILPASYEHIGPFRHGLAKVYLGGKAGLIDAFGSVAVPPQYEDLEYLGGGLLRIQENTTWGLATTADSILLEPVYPRLDPWPWGGWLIKHQGFLGLLDSSLNRLVPMVYDTLAPMPDTSRGRLIRVMQNGRWGLLQANGQPVIPPTYSALDTKLVDGLLRVRNAENEWGLVEPNGAVRLLPNYQQVKLLGGGLVAVQLRGKWAVLDTNGATLMPPAYNEVVGFRPGYAVVRRTNDWGLINPRALEVTKLKYKDFRLLDGKYIAVLAGKRWAVLDSLARVKVTPSFDNIRYLQGKGAKARFLVSYGDGWQLTDSTFVPLHAEPYSSIRPLDTNRYAFETKAGWGIMDDRANPIWEAQFEAVRPPDSLGRFPVRTEQGWGIVHPKTKWALRPVWTDILEVRGDYALIQSGERLGIGLLLEDAFKEIEWETAPPQMVVDTTTGDTSYIQPEKLEGPLYESSVLVLPIFERVQLFQHGRAAVFRRGFWALVAPTGEQVTDFAYRALPLDSFTGRVLPMARLAY